ncbi:MAG: hypothetical protein WBB28_01950 [Crinalium sp.]
MSEVQGFFDSCRDRSTRLLKRQCESGILKLPPDPFQEKESQLFQAGQFVVTTNTSTLKPGIKLKIEQVAEDHNHFRYYGIGVWHRQVDLEAVNE